jgi:ATP-dependent helicase/nuclease subunit A
MHRLIQSLPDIPPQRRQQAAQEFLNRNRKTLADSDRDAIAAQALALLADPDFANLFAPGSRAEVPLVGTLPRNGQPPYAVTGQVDRLLVGTSEVLLADYKTNRPAPTDLPSIPKSYKRQLALYRALLQRIYPGRNVRAALVFTEIPLLLEIPANMLDAELATLTSG